MYYSPPPTQQLPPQSLHLQPQVIIATPDGIVTPSPYTPLVSKQESTNNSCNKFLDDPIFYSVLLACISFIFYIISYTNGYTYSYMLYTNQLIILSAFSILPCLLAPFIIKLCKLKISLMLSVVLLFIFLMLFKSYSGNVIYFNHFLNIFSNQLSTICITSLLIIVNWESKYINILFGLFYIIFYGLSISSSYIFNSNLNNYKIYPMVALVVIGMVFAFALSQPSHDNDEATLANKYNPVHTLQHQYFVSRESRFFYLIPILILLGMSPLPFSPFIATLAVIPIAFIMEKFSRLKAFFLLMGFALVSVISGFVLLYSNDMYYYYSNSSFFGYASAPYYVCLVSYSIFVVGTLMISTSMISSGKVFPKENVVSIVSAYQGITAVGSLLGTVIIKLISPWLYWYVSVVFLILGSLLFMLFLKVKSQNCCNN